MSASFLSRQRIPAKKGADGLKHREHVFRQAEAPVQTRQMLFHLVHRCSFILVLTTLPVWSFSFLMHFQIFPYKVSKGITDSKAALGDNPLKDQFRF